MSQITSAAHDKAATNRNIFLFFSSKLVSVLGSSMYTFVAGLFILNETGSGSSFAVTLLCGLLPGILLAPFAGVLADRVNRRRLLIGSDLASALIMSLAFLFVSLEGMSLWTIYLSLILLSICSTFYSISVSSSMMMLVDSGSVQRAGSLNQIAGSAGHLLAPILAGLLYAFLPLQDFMLLNAAGFTVSTVMGCMLRYKPIPRLHAALEPAEAAGPQPLRERLGTAVNGVRTNLKEGFAYVIRRPVLRSLMGIVFWINFFVVALNVVLPYVAVQTLGLSSKQYGVLEAMLAAGVLLMSLLLAILPQSKSPVRPILGGLSALGVLFLTGGSAAAAFHSEGHLPSLPAAAPACRYHDYGHQYSDPGISAADHRGGVSWTRIRAGGGHRRFHRSARNAALWSPPRPDSRLVHSARLRCSYSGGHAGRTERSCPQQCR
ncbi:MFS transporter [Paenibacillus sp. FSL M7-0896]|uniref:MFS transporter n=1 Tax=Paenibacillus sp. FSL M7-0896 TaxID=2921610 RepID=UPI0030DB213F